MPRRFRIAATVFVPILALAVLEMLDSGASLLASVVVAGGASVAGACAGVWLSPVLNAPTEAAHPTEPSRRVLAVGVLVGLCASIVAPNGPPLAGLLGVVAGFMAAMAFCSPKLAADRATTADGANGALRTLHDPSEKREIDGQAGP